MGSDEESEYCPICHNLSPYGSLTDRDEWLRNQYGVNRITLDGRQRVELQDSNCDHCKLLLQACDHFSLEWEELTMWIEPDQDLRATLMGKDFSISFEMWPEGEETCLEMPKLHAVAEGATSEESLQFIDNCMAECLQHEACVVPTFTPKRLLQIDNTRLVEPTEHCPYLALSYCWGTRAVPLRTLKDNIESYRQSISLGSLPLVMQEAASISQRIGINYMWIDSLCIIQDDAADWDDQYPLMASIYESAHLVLAAASSNGCQESFIKSRLTEAFTVSQSLKCSIQCFKIQRVEGTGIHEDYEGFYGTRDPLDTRGWPFQERLLATRLLVFSSAELQWLCNTFARCEGGHRDSPHHRSRSLYSLKADEAYDYWHEQVMEFSKRKLTYPRDKLPAIAGVAVKINKMTASEYIAGCWRENLVKDLLWERHMWQSNRWEASSCKIAPSFSWASVMGNVFYGPIGSASKGTYVTEAIDAACTSTTANHAFGEIQDGFVVLRGPLLDATISTPPDWDDDRTGMLFHVRHGNWVIRLRSDTHLRQGIFPPSGNDDGGRTACRTVESKQSHVDSAQAWILIAAYWFEHVRSTDLMWITCLVLGKSESHPGCFERLGHNNQPWPLTECELSSEEYDALNPFVYGTGPKTTIKIV